MVSLEEHIKSLLFQDFFSKLLFKEREIHFIAIKFNHFHLALVLQSMMVQGNDDRLQYL